MDYDLLNLLDEDDEDERVYQASIQLKRFLDDYADSGHKSSVAEFKGQLNSLQNSWGVEFDTDEIVNEFVNNGLLTR